MNDFNKKRLQGVIKLSKDIEEELLPAYFEEECELKRVCELEQFGRESDMLYARIHALEDALKHLKALRSDVSCVLSSMEAPPTPKRKKRYIPPIAEIFRRTTYVQENKDSHSAYDMPAVPEKLR